MGSGTKRTAKPTGGAGKSAPARSRAPSEEIAPGAPLPGSVAAPALPPPPRRRAANPAVAQPSAPAPQIPSPAVRKPAAPFARKAIFEQLEPRFLLSADLNPLVTDALFAGPSLQPAEFRSITDTGLPQVVTTFAVAPPIQRTNEIVFVDTATPDYQRLVEDMRNAAPADGRSLRFVLIDADSDGLARITETLAQQSAVDAVHVISHARDGAVQLGGTQLDLDTVTKRAGQIASWGLALTAEADILFYGCDLAASAEGQSLIEALARLTGADVAASTDKTGAAAEGGNWELEFAAGSIQARVAIGAAEATQWAGLLALPVVDLNGPGSFTASDAFPTATYAGGTGWNGGWVEFDASPNRFIAGSGDSDNNPATGNVLHSSLVGGGGADDIAFVGHAGQLGDSIQRAVNLLPYTSAQLTFNYQLVNVEAADVVAAQISTDGGATFTTLGTYSTTGGTTGSASFNIASYISDKAVIRFAVTGGYDDSSDRFFFDDVVITASGNNYDTTFTEGGAAVAIAGAATTVTDADVTQFQGATVTLNNPQAGDVLAIGGALPGGITGTVVGNTVTLSGLANGTSYANALKLITFSNTGNAPSTMTRTLSIQATDAGGETSAVSTSYVRVVSVDSLAVAQPDSFSGPNFGSIAGNVLADNGAGADFDVDATAPLSVSTTLVQGPAAGTVVLNSDGTFTYTPTAVGTYTFQYRLISLAQVPGTTYEYWGAPPAGNNLGTGFPTTAPTGTGTLSGYDVDQAAISSGDTDLNNFTVRFTSQFDVTTAGTYAFWSGSDDGSRLYIDGALVVNNDGAHSYAEVSNTVSLAAGRHTIRVDFFEVSGQEDLIVSYAGADTGGVKTNMSGAVGMLAPTYSTGTVTIIVTGSAPQLDLDGSAGGTGFTTTFTENGAVRPLADTDITLTDSDSANLTGATITLTNSQAGDQLLAGAMPPGITANVAGNVVTLSGSASLASYRTALQAVSFQNTSEDPSTTARTVQVVVTDGMNSSNTAVATINVTAVNDQPTLTATGVNPTFTEDGAAVDLFNGVSVSTVEAGQTITRLDLTVSNLGNGAAEQLTIDGTTFSLTNGTTGTTATNGMTYNVTVAGSTATVTLTRAAGVAVANVQTLVDGIAYRNTSQTPTAGNRVVTLTRIDDSGSNTAPERQHRDAGNRLDGDRGRRGRRADPDGDRGQSDLYRGRGGGRRVQRRGGLDGRGGSDDHAARPDGR